MKPGDVLELVAQELHVVLIGMGLDTEVVSGAAAVGHRFHDPVDVEPDEVHQLARRHCHFSGVDTVGAIDAATPALGALIEVVVPLLEDFLGELAAAGDGAENPANGGEVLTVNGTQQLRSENRHVLGIARADEKVTLVGARSAAHADVHEHLERAVLLEKVLEAFINDLLPIFGQLPVGVGG